MLQPFRSCKQRRDKQTQLVIVFLVEINQPRLYIRHGVMTPTSLMTGGFDGSLSIATTKWSDCVIPADLRQGKQRQAELSTMYLNKVHKFEDTTKSAWEIIDACPDPPMINLSDLGDRLKAILPKEKPRRIRLLF